MTGTKEAWFKRPVTGYFAKPSKYRKRDPIRQP